MDFISFPKIPRLSRKMFITEKIDGTNAVILIEHVPTQAREEGISYDQVRYGDKEILFNSNEWTIRAGSRNRWITPEQDNYGFALWVKQNKKDLLTLGPGYHYGEWWGVGIQRGYALHEKRFSLFNVGRWTHNTKPSCCSIVPLLYEGEFDTTKAEVHLALLKENGSVASPGYMNPEGIIIFHEASRSFFKKTLENDEKGKEQ